MAAVSDATVLIALARIGYLWLLEELWDSVVIPEAVHQEVMRGFLGKDEITEAINSNWIKVQKVQNQRMVRFLQSNLRGRGECECIILAEEISAKVVLVDDKKARKVAQQGSVEVIGTLGLLALVVKEKVLSKKEAVEGIRLLMENEFRLSDSVIQRTISLFDEI